MWEAPADPHDQPVLGIEKWMDESTEVILLVSLSRNVLQDHRNDL